MKAILVAAAVLAILQASCAENNQCDEGEVYKDGVSSSCGEYRCGERKGDVRACTKDSVSGCFCDDSHYRRPRDNKCVLEEEC